MTPDDDPTQLLAELIRFDTTNPPGNEKACVAHLADRLTDAGLDTTLLAADPDRPNLIARLSGRGEAPPLLLYGHVDVVTTAHQEWTHPPFAGRVVDGWIWGRGALDMKGAVAMMTTAVLRAAKRGLTPAGDVLLAFVADEEAGGKAGARFLVEEYPETFGGAKYAIGEFGGVPIHVAGRRFYAIQVAEKQPCWLEVTLRGPGGHGARPMRGGAMAALGRILSDLDRGRTPIHVTPVARRMIASIADEVGGVKGVVLRRLLNRRLTDRLLRLLGTSGAQLEPLFRNTVNATTVRGGEKGNVIPTEIALGLDGRILPGFGPEDLIGEIRDLTKVPFEPRILLHDPSTAETDLGLFDTLAGILRELDPGTPSFPLLLPGSTDARFFDRLGIQTYGFTPMNLPHDFDFFSTIHAADERVPCEAIEFGTQAIGALLERYGASG